MANMGKISNEKENKIFKERKAKKRGNWMKLYFFVVHKPNYQITAGNNLFKLRII